MRITHDKNDDPFGFCEKGCGQQLRVGGNPARVRAFVARFPWAAKPGAAPAAAPVTVTEAKPEPIPAQNPVTVTEIHHGPVKRRSAFEDALTVLGGIGK